MTPSADRIRDAVLGKTPRSELPDWQAREYALILHGAFLAMVALGHREDAQNLKDAIASLRREEV